MTESLKLKPFAGKYRSDFTPAAVSIYAVTSFSRACWSYARSERSVEVMTRNGGLTAMPCSKIRAAKLYCDPFKQVAWTRPGRPDGQTVSQKSLPRVHALRQRRTRGQYMIGED